MQCRQFIFTKNPERDISKVDTLVIHRIGVGANGDEVNKWFAANPEHTGGLAPYHFVVGGYGVDQCLALSQRGEHVAGGMNTRSIGIACIGDFRHHMMLPAQEAHLQAIIRVLNAYLGGLKVIGHTEAGPKATKQPGKQCPGKYVDLDGLRNLITIPAQLADHMLLVRHGVVV